MNDERVPRLLRVKEVAKLTGIEPWRVYELIERGQGPPHMRIGRTIRISEKALVEWIERRHEAGSSSATAADADESPLS